MKKPPVIPQPHRRKRSNHMWFLALIGAILCFSLLYHLGYFQSPEKRLKDFVSGGLAPIPKSATNVMFYQWNGLFTGETYAKFEASPEDLQAFIEGSRELQIKPAYVFSSECHLLPFPENSEDRDPRHAYFLRYKRMPDWFAPIIRGKGRQFNLWPADRVYIDEERNIVWLHFIKG